MFRAFIFTALEKNIRRVRIFLRILPMRANIYAKNAQNIYTVTAPEQLEDKHVLVVDDVISTGESLEALKKLVEMAGGNIVGKMTILAEGDAIDREDITYLEELPLFNADGTVK